MRAFEFDFADETRIQNDSVSNEGMKEWDGRLVVPRYGAVIDDELVRALREVDQR